MEIEHFYSYSDSSRENRIKNGLFITQDKEKISCISKSGPGWLALHIACDDRKKSWH